MQKHGKSDLKFGANIVANAMPNRFLNATNNFFFLLLLLRYVSQTLSVTDGSSEVNVLFSWLHSTSSPPSVFSNWNSQDSNPCKWSFITCSSDSYVTEINIQSVQLNLPFPSNLSSLHFLQKLVISGANLTGTIPPAIGDCLSLTAIDVNSNNLEGSIPRTIGNLRNLKSLELFDNRLSGSIPTEIGNLLSLEIFRAGGNDEIGGNIPDKIGDCVNLQVLGLAETKISGAIPSSLSKLKNLQVLSVYTTMLTGEIPGDIGNCSELVNVYLYENSLSGSLPKELGKLQKLEKLLLWRNNFIGSIPEEIGNCKSLVIFDVSLNFFTGTIPESFGNLTNIQELMLSSNNISGSIPAVLYNATNLVQLQIDSNQISGSIPPELGFLSQLQVFYAWDNKLEGNIPLTISGCKSLQVLDLSQNSLTGILPPSIFQIRNLTKLLLIFNDISGIIPPEVGSCVSLIRLRLAGNRINGEVPKQIGFLSNLSFLDLSNNRLRGILPDEIGNCGKLQMLNLAGNSLNGTLPSSLSFLSKLEVLDFSTNQFSGPIHGSFGELLSLNRLSLSNNALSGEIPSAIGRCSRLQLLDLSQNLLFGSIPVEIFKIETLEIALNLSCNFLTGVIPPQIEGLNKLSVLDISHNKLGGDLMSLSTLLNLVSLNISYNNFTGFLPDNKLFRQLSATELAGNQFLSSAYGMGMAHNRHNKRLWRLKLSIALLSVVAIALSILGIVAVLKVKKMNNGNKNSEFGIVESSSSWKFSPFQKLNFSVEQVVRCLVESNVIGKGCSGIVYRAEFENGEAIAVKKLWPTTVKTSYNRQYDCLTTSGIRDSFSTEVRTLGSIRHKNIVKFLGCCWNHNTRLLMYDYMPNGSLGRVLHEKSLGCLEWDVRYKIILGSAQGIAYLHHDCVPPIIHRDIKANNILIGLDFEPYIADFGLAKLVDDRDFARASNTFAGSYGYIAPEYGFMTKITEKSDVYSYGVVVLEVLTSKQPNDPTIPDGLHIVDWVRQKQDRDELLDSGLRMGPNSEIQEMMQTLGVAMLCVQKSPDDRPTMKDVAAMLKEIRSGREENEKVDGLIRKGSQVGDGEENKSNDRGASSAMQSLYLQSSVNSSFSASSLLDSASLDKFGIGKQ